jgi:hypothetical protein
VTADANPVTVRLRPACCWPSNAARFLMLLVGALAAGPDLGQDEERLTAARRIWAQG